MRRTPLLLINGATLDLVPTRVMWARAAGVQRLLAANEWLLRRKIDGRFLGVGTHTSSGMRWRWLSSVASAPLAAEANALARAALSPKRAALSPKYAARSADSRSRMPDSSAPRVDLDRHAELAGLPRVGEPALLCFAGPDRFGRPLWLDAPAVAAWHGMRAAALREGIVLHAISGFRSRAYQSGIFRRKLARGDTLQEILAVNAAPGYSEHHSGRALDIGTPGEPPAEESFEATPAFAWLAQSASRFGFAMSYPRGNPHGITYEPWHWMWRARPAARNASD